MANPIYQVTFTNANGISVNLNDHVNTFIPVGVSGDLMPEFDFQEAFSPLVPGSIVSGVKAKPRSFTIPVMVVDTDRRNVIDRARAIMAVLNPMLGNGTLYITDREGEGPLAYFINCRYKTGAQSDGTGSEQFTYYMKWLITFYADDPFFYFDNMSGISIGASFAPNMFFPIFPLSLAPSSAVTSNVVTNSGNVEAWPIITITGPGSRFVISNTTTGKTIDIDGGLSAGEVLTVDTRPRTRSVRDQAGTNRFSYLTPTSSLFNLLAGDNTIGIEIYGGDTATEVMLEFSPTFLF